MSIASTLCVGQVLTAEELLKIELHNHKNFYNRPTLQMCAKTVDGIKQIHINPTDVAYGKHRSDAGVIEFLKLPFKIIAHYPENALPQIICDYVGDLSSIEHLINVDVILSDIWLQADKTTFIATVKPQTVLQIYSYNDDKTILKSPYVNATFNTHPEILNTLKRIKDNSGRAFVD